MQQYGSCATFKISATTSASPNTGKKFYKDQKNLYKNKESNSNKHVKKAQHDMTKSKKIAS